MFEPIEKSSSCFVVGPFVLEGENKNFTPKEIKAKILKHLNADPARTKEHSAHLLVYDFENTKGDRKIVGFKCNCGEEIFHQINDDGRPQWNTPVYEKQMTAIRGGTLVDFI